MKPLISYYGGKQRMAHHIIPLIPKHTVYVEPFCGGAAIFFMKPYPQITCNTAYREVLNDTSKDLVNLYRVLQTRHDELIHLLKHTLYSEAEHKKSTKILKRKIDADKLWRAWAYYVNVSQSFSKSLMAGWGRSMSSQSQAETWVSRTDILPTYLERMRHVHIACNDALKVIKQWDSPQTFFYCDPPYPGTECCQYRGYALADLQALVDALSQCQGSFILSNYDQPGLTVPKDWERLEFSTLMSGNNYNYEKNRERVEVVWRRFNSVPVAPEIQSMYDSGGYDCFAKSPQDKSLMKMKPLFGARR